jgi:hypothetical protein
MDISFFCLLFLSNFSFGSIINKPNLPVIDKTFLDAEFINMINNHKSCTKLVHSEHDPVVFGNHTIFSIFQVLVEITMPFYTTPTSTSNTENFDSLVVKNYFPLIKKYFRNDIKRFIQFLKQTKVFPFKYSLKIFKLTNRRVNPLLN